MWYKITIWLLFVCGLIFTSCNKEGIGQFDDAVVESASNTNKFKQITFTLNIVDSQNEYVLLNKIDSVKLKANGKNWGTFASEIVDTIYKTDKISGDLRFTNLKTSYLLIAPYQLLTDKLETAGDVVNYLNNRIILQPGDYVCEIYELKFKNIQNEWVSLKPQVYKDFKVIENTVSSYAGDITVTIK